MNNNVYVKKQTDRDIQNQLKYANEYMNELNKRIKFIEKSDDNIKGNIIETYDDKKNNGCLEDNVEKEINLKYI